MQLLERDFYAVSADRLAKRLLNKVLVARGVSGRIVEVEAYLGGEDPASHAYRGMTRRNEVMFGPAGFLYVYFTYGMHFCCNVVGGREGVANAVLIRALEPLTGLDLMRKRRRIEFGSKAERELTNGPAKLCQALAIDRSDNGADLVSADLGIGIYDDGVKPPKQVMIGPRVGIRVAVESPLRFWVPGNPNVSRYKD